MYVKISLECLRLFKSMCGYLLGFFSSASVLNSVTKVVLPPSFELLAILLQRANMSAMVDLENKSTRVYVQGAENFFNTCPVDSGAVLLFAAYVKHPEIAQCLLHRSQLASDSEEAIMVCNANECSQYALSTWFVIIQYAHVFTNQIMNTSISMGNSPKHILEWFEKVYDVFVVAYHFLTCCEYP